MINKRILHIAPQNISDVPMTFVRAERALGYESRLVTLFPDPRGYPEDICLNLPFVNADFVKKIKRLVSNPARLEIKNQSSASQEKPPVWRANGLAEKALIFVREWFWEPMIYDFMQEIGFWSFDVYQFDAGLDFFRDGRTVRRLKAHGKKVIVCYTGSDLRTRGIIEPVDALADVRVTVEWDHLDLHPNLQHVLFPFEPEKYAFRQRENDGKLRIGHAPTNRAAKGSERILAVLERIKNEREIEIVLIENLPHAEAIKLKDSCDIFIDQIGDLGYGINALEALALGVPTCTSLTPHFLSAYPDHPFWEIDDENLYEKILSLIDSEMMRDELTIKGRAWVEKCHESRQIVHKVHQLTSRIIIS